MENLFKPDSNGSLLAYFLLSMFSSSCGWGGSYSILPTLSVVSEEDWQSYKKESENATEEEKTELYKKYLDKEGKFQRYANKLSKKDGFDDLNKKLSKYDKKITEWTAKRQKAIDDWINE